MVHYNLDTAAVLTPAQRDYLLNPEDYDKSPAAERQMRERIRERVATSMADLAILLRMLPEEDMVSALEKVYRPDALAFLFRHDVGDLFPEPDYEYPSHVEITTTEGDTRVHLDHDLPEPINSNLGILEADIEKALEEAISVEVPEHIEKQIQLYEIDIDADISVRFSKVERLNIADLEHQLQEGTLTFYVLRQYYADSKITLTEFQQLTRGEELDGEPVDWLREELLSQPVPILDSEPPEGYMRIKNSDSAPSLVHEDEIMPPGYNIRFDEDGEAVVLQDVGERAVEWFESFESVADDEG